MTAPSLRRIPVQSMGYYAFADASAPGSGPAPLLLGLHGYGQSAPDFLSVITKLAPPGARVAAGQGFNQLWDPSTKKVSFSWLTAYEKADSTDRNNRYILKIIDELAGGGIADPAAVFLLGFSQGSSVAFRFAQAHPGRARGIISICADLPPDVEANLSPLARAAVLIAYGLRDPIFPQDRPIHAFDALRAAAIEAEIISFDRGHIIPSSIAPRVQDWITRQTRRPAGSIGPITAG